MVFNYTQGWELLMAGAFVDAALYPYVHLMGGMFYGIMAFLAMSMVYLKTENYGTTGVTGLLIAAAGIVYLPVQIRFLATIFMVLSFTIIMYKIFKG